jgi:glycyl-tRNA synthetase
VSAPNIDTIVSLAKRRGFVYPSSEIYGGLGSAWDYGPLGVELANNVRAAWWRWMVHERDDIEGLDSSIILNRLAWKYSGHEETFTDPLVDCRECKTRLRADKLEDGKCPNCGSKNVTEPRPFNLMFRTHVGATAEDDADALVYLRPETAQGIFINFHNVLNTSRRKLPFGVAQIGKSFRNEVTPGNFIFRTREFEQMEMQFFVKPGTDVQWFEYWRGERMRWFADFGMRAERLQFHQHEPDKLAHYAKDAFDIEYQFPFGWGEIEGIHNRTDFDLSRHQTFSGKSMQYFDDGTKERFLPYIIETSAGASRSFMAFLVDAYREEDAPTADGGTETRVVLRLHPKLAPVKAAVFPLVNRDGMPELARSIEQALRPHYRVFYDDSGAVGRRYRRQDEVGTPYCITVDSQTLQDQTVTVRDRDSMQQERIASDAILRYLRDHLG